MLLSGPAFPTIYPTGYKELEEDIVFDPKRHLDLQFPERIWSLEEFGYSEEDIHAAASPVAVASSFKLLSVDGVKAFHHVSTTLQAVCTHIEGGRVPKHLAGGSLSFQVFTRSMCEPRHPRTHVIN